MGLVLCLWIQSNDEDDAVPAVSVLFLVFRDGLNDSCLISSSARILLSSSRLRLARPMLLSGEQHVVSTFDKAPLPLELQDTLRGSVALVVEVFTLTSLLGPAAPIDDHPLKDDVRRCVLDSEVVDE